MSARAGICAQALIGGDSGFLNLERRQVPRAPRARVQLCLGGVPSLDSAVPKTSKADVLEYYERGGSTREIQIRDLARARGAAGTSRCNSNGLEASGGECAPAQRLCASHTVRDVACSANYGTQVEFETRFIEEIESAQQSSLWVSLSEI